MQFTSTLLFAITLLGANAAPAPWNNPPGNQNPPPNNQNSCPTTETTMCCNNDVGLLALNCVLSDLVSGGCQDQTICCQNYGSGSVTCTQQDGTYINIPINIWA